VLLAQRIETDRNSLRRAVHVADRI
jgi:hypothetical protein